jgi:hypothetical protein
MNKQKLTYAKIKKYRQVTRPRAHPVKGQKLRVCLGKSHW